MKNWRFLVSLGLVCGLLPSCKDKIDLAHIDTRMEADLGLVLPIGSAHASFADLLLTKTLGENFFIEDNLLTYKQTLEYNVNFHPIDGQQFMGQGEQTLHITMLPSGQYTITIPIELTLANVNTDVTNERIDSMLLSQAILSSSITKTGLDELDWTWIENITLHLGDQMCSAKGKDIPIYRKGDLGGFGQSLPALLEDVSLSFMVNKNLDPVKDTLYTYNANVGNTWSLSATIQLNVPTGQTLTPGNLSYNYSFAATELKAVWGYFKPSDDLKVKDKIKLAEQWDFWKKLDKVVLPFDRPAIQFDVNTSISATVELDVKEIYMASSATEDTVYATFNGERQTTYFFDDHIGLDPASLGQRTTYSAAIDNTEQHGRLDSCFAIAPDVCAFAFNIVPTDPQHHPVMRLVNDVKPMEVNLTTRFPFSFKPGVHVFYTDTLREIDFSKVALDSLLKQVQVVEEVKQADLNLYIHATNDIPLDITGTFVFQDKDGQDLHILDSALVFKASDTTTHVITVHESDFDRIAQTKRIIIDADGSDLSLQSHPECYPIQVTGESGLKLFFGFAGNVDAILNFNNKKQ